MTRADTSEKGLETRAIKLLLGKEWVETNASGFNTDYCFFVQPLVDFIIASQPNVARDLDLQSDSPIRHKALSRIQDEISRRGVIDVLRNGIKHNQHEIILFYTTPSEGNLTSSEKYAFNSFSVTRQVHFSKTDSGLSVDLVLSINGIPIFTFELKNQLTRQDYSDAITQYKTDRNPNEPIFKFKRLMGHFAVDDSEVWFTTKLAGHDSWFLPFNRGFNDGAGNPVNQSGLKTDYLWEEVLLPSSLVDIIENYAQVVEEESLKTGTKREVQIFPRYHQLEVVRKILSDVRSSEVGKKYLIQHSAGSGKSNSIAWLAHQLVGIKSLSQSGITDCP